MLGRKKTLLRLLINKEFSDGINKISLFNSLEVFIDKNYPEVNSKGNIYFTASEKTKIIHELAFDIKRAGGLDRWKEKLVSMTTPVIGSLPPKHKKQNKH